MLPLGCWVVAVFAFIFLFYSISFLLRQRNREFGLYNILGLDKRNLGHIVFWETLISGGISLIGGLALGIAFSKLTEAGMLNILNEEIDYTFCIDFVSVRKTVLIFSIIYAALFIKSFLNVRLSNPIALLHSSNVGGKPPKANWLLAVSGLLCLAGAYYMAVSIQKPLSVLIWFFVAVLMVIVSTYLLFIAGSVALCRLLQKNKRYYYQPKHFVSVSSMVYRMKRNGAGLASICILLTMVLVMLSSTVSLYAGAEDSLNQCYPFNITMRIPVPEIEQWNEESFAKMRNVVREKVSDQKNVQEYALCEIGGLFTENGITVEHSVLEQFGFDTYENVGYMDIISLDEYNRIMGTNKTLEADECFLYCYRTEYTGSTFTIQGGVSLKVKEVLTEMFIPGHSVIQVIPTITLVTMDIEAVAASLMSKKDAFEDILFWSYSFDMTGGKEEQIAAYDLLRKDMDDIVIRREDGSYGYSIDSKEASKVSFYGLYGGLFFIGILLSIVFLFAAVLIIYYKQISEGLEDQKRFAIMQKVGMTKKDIRKSVNSQILTVFFLPILFAGLHLGFAFPAIWKILQLFGFYNLTLMILVTASCFLIFAICYTLVYKITSNAYLAIVSGNQG